VIFLLSTDVNVTAERALLRLKAKLQGTESGKSTTVEDQVGTLIPTFRIFAAVILILLPKDLDFAETGKYHGITTVLS
jgi:hypothetical protein